MRSTPAGCPPGWAAPTLPATSTWASKPRFGWLPATTPEPLGPAAISTTAARTTPIPPPRIPRSRTACWSSAPTSPGDRCHDLVRQARSVAVSGRCRQGGGFLPVRLRRRRAEAPRGDVGILQVARRGIGESDFRVQFDPGGNPHALGGSPPVRMILTVDDPTPVGFRNPDVTLRPRSAHERDRRDNPASDRRRGGCGHARRGFFAARAWRPKIKASVRSFVVVVPHVLVEDPHKLASTQISIQSRPSRRTVLTQRSANAFARGARTDVVMTQGAAD